MHPIAGLMRPAAGEPCWLTWHGYGSFVHGDSHLWIYCCRWSLTLEGCQLAHEESDDITMDRALAALNGQILTAIEIGPDSRTAFSLPRLHVPHLSRVSGDLQQ
jgi:hypothetical protein